MKRIELFLSEREVNKVCKAIRKAGVPGYSVIRHVTGMGLAGEISESMDFSVNESELDSARWMSREELRTENLPKDGSFFMPRRDSIARRLIEEWLGHEAGPSINS